MPVGLGGQAFRRTRSANVRSKNFITPRCFRITIAVLVVLCVLAVLIALYVVLLGQARMHGDSLSAAPSRWESVGATEFKRPVIREEPAVAAVVPAVDAGTASSLRRQADVVVAPETAAPAQPQRRRRVLLSEGKGKWNTGVWPNWGSPDVMLNWAAAGVRVTRTCPKAACDFVHGDDGRESADAIVMELVNHPKFGLGKNELIPWPEKRPNPKFAVTPVLPDKRPVPESLPLVGLFYFEPTNQYPGYTTASPEVMAHVDFSVTPELSSTLPITLICPWGHPVADFVTPAPKKIPGNFIAYFNEHGIAPEYSKLVNELFEAAGVNIHAFINRRNHDTPPEAVGEPYALENRLKFLSTYKFHLVTEFKEQDSWIEPEWSQTFLAGTVPIYIGAPNIHIFAPGPRSFIHIRDFASGRQLWEYLQLFADGAPGADAKYEQFHRWRSGAVTAAGQDEPTTPNPLGTGDGISREQVPNTDRVDELLRWVAKPPTPSSSGAEVPDLDNVLTTVARDNPRRNILSEFNGLAMSSWRAFRIHLDSCVHYAECRICEWVTAMTQ